MRRLKYDAVEREFTIISMRLLKLSNDFKHLASALQVERDVGSVSGMSGNEPPKENEKLGLKGTPQEFLSDLF